MLECRNLRRTFGPLVAVSDLSYAVRPGQIGGLLGLNGAGKTTTMSILATLLAPTGGHAFVGGHDVVRAPSKVRASLGYQPESNHPVLPWWTPYETLGYFAHCHGIPAQDADPRIMELARALDFTAYLHKATRSLSGGTKRKVELARTLLHRPQVLLLDEPTREMDIPTKRKVWALLEDLATGGTTILIASHDPLEIRRLCATVCVLRDSAVAYQGDVKALLGQGSGDIDASLAALLTGSVVG